MKFLISFLVLLLASLAPSPGMLGAHTGEDHIFVLPNTTPYEPGSKTPTEVHLNAREPITSFRILLHYDPAALEVEEVKPNTESFPFWWKQEAANGIVELEASLPAPGFQGEGLAAVVVLAAKEAGDQLLVVDEDSSLFLNGQDENILAPEEISPQSDFGTAENNQRAGTGFTLLLLSVLLGAGGVIAFVVLQQRRKK